jgi:hypothetical protein
MVPRKETDLLAGCSSVWPVSDPREVVRRLLDKTIGAEQDYIFGGFARVARPSAKSFSPSVKCAFSHARFISLTQFQCTK